ncbi:MAG: PorT family protein [Lewinellaceae bacterium]|nr:PorT family protein [Lewinellaceae bacterium]MCB9289608.1 PorT family protein [Lewinellaceae bacterium]
MNSITKEEKHMKTSVKWMALAAFTVFTFAAQAQVSLGLRGGYQMANINATKGLDALAPDFKTIDAFSIGAVMEVPLGYGFNFQPELAYSRKGFSIQESTALDLFNIPVPVGVEALSRFDYLEAPLLMKYKFGDGRVNAYIAAGPTFGYALDGQLITRANALVDIKLIDTDIDLNAINYERFEVAGTVAGGLSFYTPFGQLFLDARYNHGFTQVYDIPVVDEKARNKSFGINVGFMVPIGG